MCDQYLLTLYCLISAGWLCSVSGRLF